MTPKWIAGLVLGMFLLALGGDAPAALVKKPDLVGSLVSLTPGTTLTRGKSFTVTGKLTNKGTAAAIGKIKIKATATGLFPISDTVYQTINLQPGKSVKFSYTGKVPAFTPPGKYTVTLMIDAGNVVKESNELNNTVSLGKLTVK